MEDDVRIAQYLAAKEAREAGLAAEREAAAHEKELEVSRMRAQQERAIDRQGEVDELRARRWGRGLGQLLAAVMLHCLLCQGGV